MTEHLDRAFVLAQRLADNYAQIPAVEAVALAGSRTSGSSDQDSDIDLYVYSSAVLPLDQRAKVAAGAKRAELGNEFWEPGDEWIDPETGISVDVMFRATPWIEDQLDRVLRRQEASVGYSTCFWYNVRYSQALFDRAGCFATVQQKANQPYPEGLKRAIVAKNHPILRNNMSSYLHQIEKALQRQDSVSVNHRLTALLASYFDILFAVNEQPHPGEKRLLAFAERLCPQRPPHLREHVTGALASPTASNLNTLIDGLDTLLRRQKLLPL